ncbi:protein timeless homolog, partial [Lucilia sericata]|uniref:protein timeless homolog n=1 Tax=Lucilia sericata TaxID=13632 RepID=UPI0018A86256
ATDLSLIAEELYFTVIDPSENDQNDGENFERSDDDDEENEEIADDGMVEKTFKFDDFAKRLLNPKIVRACVVVLSDWEQIPTKSLKAAVTILHRIAYGCSCPAMLYQAKLFRIFQQVFHAGRDAHHEELRRLGIFVVRKFVETAPNNPKIYAELLFYKSIKEANELESGYCDAYESGTKGTWTEEQESELRFLFEENQRNPETDKDVIDWILENIGDRTRTRRGVLKKLKELGLKFKAPTKKSTADAHNKNLWRSEEDEELRSLYDQYRTEDDCLQRILDEFAERRNKQAIIKRMLQLHIIADKSEILPQKPRKRKSKKQMENGEEEGGEHDEYEFMEEPTFDGTDRPSTSRQSKAKKPAKAKARKIVRTPLDVGTVRALLGQVDAEKYQEAIDWLKECLDDAADDTDEPAEEDDGVPLVPLQELQKEAMEDGDFKKVLVALGIQPPVFGMESYWRIPTYLNSADLKLRAKIVAGEEVNIDVEDLEDEDNGTDNESAEENVDNRDGDESEEDYLETLGMAKERKKLDNLENYMDQQREKMKNLMFSKSDEETEERAPLKEKKKSKTKKETKAKKKKQDSDSEEDTEMVDKIKKKLDKKKRNYDLSSEEDDGEGTFKKPKEKEMVKPDTTDLFDQLKAKRAKSKINLKDMMAEKDNTGEEDDVDLNFNSEDYRKRLAELGDDDEVDDDEDNEQQTLSNRSRRANVIESDSDDADGNVVDNVNKANNRDKQAFNDTDDDDDNNNADDDSVKSIKKQQTGDNIKDSSSKISTKKRQRSLDEDNTAEMEQEDDEDEDAKFLKRKKPSSNEQRASVIGEEPAKRRRVAVIDDDDEDD